MLLSCLAGGSSTLAGEGDASPRYRLDRQLLREDGPATPSRLVIFRDGGPLEIVLPPGADVWRDASAEGYLVVSFMDRRFSSFRSTGLDFVDLETGRRSPLVRGLIWRAADAPPGVLVGVRRVPREARVLLSSGDVDEYTEAVFELFVLSFDPSSPRWTLVPIRTAPWLPDANQPYPPGEPLPVRVRVQDGVLAVARDAAGATWDQVRLADLVPW